MNPQWLKSFTKHNLKPTNRDSHQNHPKIVLKSGDNLKHEKLSTTRDAIVHKFDVNTYKGYLIVGLFNDGRVGEIFITMQKEGSTIGGLMDTIAILTSFALQSGVSIERLADKLGGTNFQPNGRTANSDIREASSVIDYIFRWLALKFPSPHAKQTTQPPNRGSVPSV